MSSFLGLFNWAGDKHVHSWEYLNGQGTNSWVGDKCIHCWVYFNGFRISVSIHIPVIPAKIICHRAEVTAQKCPAAGPHPGWDLGGP